MRYTVAVACMACLIGFAAPARAQLELLEHPQKPADTKPVYIAMLFEKIIQNGGTPDFEDWVRRSSEYNEAPLYERPNIVEKNTKALADTYKLITFTEPITLSVKARISDYAPTAHGFLVQNFQDLNYFDYTYMGERYAVIPNGISKYQWLKAVPEERNEIMRETDNGRNAGIVITMVPISADPKPMKLNGKTYHLLMTDISKIEMWSKDGNRVIWDDKLNAPASVRSQLLDLFQH